MTVEWILRKIYGGETNALHFCLDGAPVYQTLDDIAQWKGNQNLPQPVEHNRLIICAERHAVSGHS